ncbi:MAG: DNA polymerase III subunit gamma/tau, partial [Proteobacteria bacterium]|nr:DNA polymerase III subunit gamma/tau [Pseudomonadota bacterium]
MSYLVLARKWRPRAFAELVGQEHVVRALANALDSGRVHHAFLFTGTRGVGKTTVARLLAKALNCETGVSSRPCGTCSACREIDEGRFVDLIEVDAASRTKVEDTRELLENVQYAPARGRYKVYLIDEVHMLSGHSFNALLKTLEEPPPHVKFLLATTDPQKLPVTVVSRCLQFHLKRLPPSLIVERLTAILAAEGIAAEPAALPLLARAADGSLRDALSLLDQALVFGANRIVEADVRAMLGTIDRGHVVRLAEALAAGDAAALVATLRALDEHAPDYDQVLVELAGLLERVALKQLVPGAGAGED